MYTVYFIFFQVASATATRFGLSRGLQYDQINESESESISAYNKLALKYASCEWTESLTNIGPISKAIPIVAIEVVFGTLVDILFVESI